jgi:Riboflavin kinase
LAPKSSLAGNRKEDPFFVILIEVDGSSCRCHADVLLHPWPPFSISFSTMDTLSPHKLPIRIVATVVRGFGRGSKDLGIPTANLDFASMMSSMPFDDLPTGIYWGYAKIGAEEVYKAAISIGYNPTYGNTEKTVEPHCIALANDPRRHSSCTGETLLQDFYEQTCRLSVVGYLRPELPFEGIEKLVEAIKQDISNTEQLADSSDPTTLQERKWVASNDSV